MKGVARKGQTRRGAGLRRMARITMIAMDRSATASFSASRIETRLNPLRPACLARFRLFAVLGTWMEADIVEATVANARAQGCERVYVVDNGSSDETVEAARSAGAILGARLRYCSLRRGAPAPADERGRR